MENIELCSSSLGKGYLSGHFKGIQQPVSQQLHCQLILNEAGGSVAKNLPSKAFQCRRCGSDT